MKTDSNLGLKSLVALRGADFRKFYAMLEKFAADIGFNEMNGDRLCDWEITADLFTDVGFSADEASALVFIIADGAQNLTAIDNWFAMNKKAVSLL